MGLHDLWRAYEKKLGAIFSIHRLTLETFYNASETSKNAKFLHRIMISLGYKNDPNAQTPESDL